MSKRIRAFIKYNKHHEVQMQVSRVVGSAKYCNEKCHDCILSKTNIRTWSDLFCDTRGSLNKEEVQTIKKKFPEYFV